MVNDGLFFGGMGAATGAPPVDATSQWNGAVYSVADRLNVSRSPGSAGATSNASLAIGGSPGDCSVELFTTVWTINGNQTLHPHYQTQGCGSATNAFIAGGISVDAESYNGISWGAEGNVPYSVERSSHYGNPNSAGIAGLPHSGYSSSLGYNGTSWSADVNMVTRCAYTNATPSGTPLATKCIIDSYNYTYTVQDYNGTSWSVGTALLMNHGFEPFVIGNFNDALVACGADTTNIPSRFHDSEMWDGVAWTMTNPNIYEVFLGGAGGSGSEPPICWNYTAKYKGSNKLFKTSGPGAFPRKVRVPGNVDKSSGKMIDDGELINPNKYKTL